jgi:hypothetical protein
VQVAMGAGEGQVQHTVIAAVLTWDDMFDVKS